MTKYIIVVGGVISGVRLISPNARLDKFPFFSQSESDEKKFLGGII